MGDSREEERTKNRPSSGHCIRVVFSRNPRENPDAEGATTSGWSSEQLHPYNHNSYATTSEHSTFDINIDSNSTDLELIRPPSAYLETTSRRSWSREVYTEMDHEFSGDFRDGRNASDLARQFFDSQIISEEDYDVQSVESYTRESHPPPDDSQDNLRIFEEDFDAQLVESDTSESHPPPDEAQDSQRIFEEDSDAQIVVSDTRESHPPSDEMQERDSLIENWLDSEPALEWDLSSSSLDTLGSLSPTHMFDDLLEDLMNAERRVLNRERPWSLEVCSICFDETLKTQNVLSLACTHRFHQSCILPWLEQQKTCPNCRKAT